MNRYNVLFVIMLFFYSDGVSGSELFTSFDEFELWMEGAFLVTTCLDWSQTKSLIKNKRNVEINPILGKRPSQARIDSYFFSAIMLHGLITYVLPHDYRKIWLANWVAIEFHVVNRNFRVGLQHKF